jgi:hypothetical protein
MDRNTSRTYYNLEQSLHIDLTHLLHLDSLLQMMLYGFLQISQLIKFNNVRKKGTHDCRRLRRGFRNLFPILSINIIRIISGCRLSIKE